MFCLYFYFKVVSRVKNKRSSLILNVIFHTFVISQHVMFNIPNCGKLNPAGSSNHLNEIIIKKPATAGWRWTFKQTYRCCHFFFRKNVVWVYIPRLFPNIHSYIWSNPPLVFDRCWLHTHRLTTTAAHGIFDKKPSPTNLS